MATAHELPPKTKLRSVVKTEGDLFVLAKRAGQDRFNLPKIAIDLANLDEPASKYGLSIKHTGIIINEPHEREDDLGAIVLASVTKSMHAKSTPNHPVVGLLSYDYIEAMEEAGRLHAGVHANILKYLNGSMESLDHLSSLAISGQVVMLEPKAHILEDDRLAPEPLAA